VVLTSKNIDKRSSGEKFLVVLESYAMNELEFSAYCREKGLYTEEVKAWREMCFKANAKNDVNRQEQTTKELLAIDTNYCTIHNRTCVNIYCLIALYVNNTCLMYAGCKVDYILVVSSYSKISNRVCENM
jgi:hypothetical protein